MRDDLWLQLLRIPASTITGILRMNVGMNRLPPWHFIVLAVPFFAAFGLTQIYGFLWCGLFIAGGLLVHGSCWLTQHFKGEPIDPDAEGKSAYDEVNGDEAPTAIIGGIIALFFHQWILGGWIIFAAICLAVAENLETSVGEFDFLKPSWLPDELPELSRPRIVAAFAVALVVDLIQIPLTFAENSGFLLIPAEIADCVLDFLAMGATTLLLGFHWALLPSVFVEAVPELDLIPTWTGCVAFVLWRRKQDDHSPDLDMDDEDDEAAPPPPPASAGPTIEDRLNRLKRLRDKQDITPEEYEAKRRKILDEL